MPKITKREGSTTTVTVKTSTASKQQADRGYKWWKAASKRDLAQQLLSTASALKTKQGARYRHASILSMLYGNQPMFNYIGSGLSKMASKNLPIDRPTMNVVQSCVDTLVSRVTQAKPKPTFLTDNGDYKQRKLAKQMNSFINGELYQTEAYDLAALMLRDASVLGTGVLKIYETDDHKVALDRVLSPDLLVDPNDAFMGKPRQLFQLKMVDREVLAEIYPESRSEIRAAEQGFLDQSSESQDTISDQIILVEAWHLPSSKEAKDGRHTIACSSGVILDEDYTKQTFPFAFLHYCPLLAGFWGQSLAEQLMGTQMKINEMLMTESKSTRLMGVPRVWLEDGSKVVKAHISNEVGMIGTYRGTAPIFMEGSTGLGADFYERLNGLIQYAYQQSGISALSATSQKPAGLNSGEAIRNFDDLQTDRFAALSRRYHNIFQDLAYLICDKAKDIAEVQGSYQTIYPNRNGTKEITLPDIKHLDDPFVIQCYDESSLPRDPSGRLQKVTEMMQSGLVTPQEGRRLLDFPDIEQVDKLANAGEERILQILDDIVENGKYTPPDPFMDLQLATQICTQYINLYVEAKLEESKAQKLRNFFTQVQNLVSAAQTPPPAPPGQAPQAAAPQAVPQPPPVSDMLPNAPQS